MFYTRVHISKNFSSCNKTSRATGEHVETCTITKVKERLPRPDCRFGCVVFVLEGKAPTCAGSISRMLVSGSYLHVLGCGPSHEEGGMVKVEVGEEEEEGEKEEKEGEGKQESWKLRENLEVEGK